MPIYEYRCERCGHQLEVRQRMSDARLTTCPVCHEEALKRLISQTSFVLKGSGWYVTDYKDKPSPSAASSASGPSDASSGSSGDSKASADTGTSSSTSGDASKSSATSSSGSAD